MPKIEGTWEDFVKTFKIVSKRKTAYSYSEFSCAELADLFADIECKGIRVSDIWVNAKTYSTMRKWGADLIHYETNKAALMQGIMGMIWGAYIIVNAKVPDSIILVIADDKGFVKTGSIMELDSDIPNSKALIKLNKEFKEVMGDFQSLMDRVSKKIQDMISVVEKNVNN